MGAAKHRAIDHVRAHKRHGQKHEELGRELDAAGTADPDAALDDTIGDDLLRLVFIACHPVLSTEARVALTLRLLGGLTTAEIARAFLVPEPTIAQRIVRAKQTLAEAKVPFEVPRGDELAARLASVLEVIYLVFNEGYAATAGDDWLRPALCDEALRLGRILAGLAPDEPEVHGLVALMEIQASRLRRARRTFGRADPAARPGPLALGPAADPPRARRARARAAARRGGAGRTRCRPRSRPATRGRDAAARPTGRGSSRCTGALAQLGAVAGRGAEPRGRGRDGVRPGGRARAGRRARGTSRRWRGTTCCRRARRTCWRGSGGGDEARGEFERAAALTRNERERALLLSRAGSGM